MRIIKYLYIIKIIKIKILKQYYNYMIYIEFYSMNLY